MDIDLLRGFISLTLAYSHMPGPITLFFIEFQNIISSLLLHHWNHHQLSSFMNSLLVKLLKECICCYVWFQFLCHTCSYLLYFCPIVVSLICIFILWSFDNVDSHSSGDAENSSLYFYCHDRWLCGLSPFQKEWNLSIYFIFYII